MEPMPRTWMQGVVDCTLSIPGDTLLAQSLQPCPRGGQMPRPPFCILEVLTSPQQKATSLQLPVCTRVTSSTSRKTRPSWWGGVALEASEVAEGDQWGQEFSAEKSPGSISGERYFI